MSVKNRESGIELVKIIAIFLIIISHVTQTLFNEMFFNKLQFNDGYYDMAATTNTDVFVLMIFRYFGALGNLIFIISSSYFLSNIEKAIRKKLLNWELIPLLYH